MDQLETAATQICQQFGPKAEWLIEEFICGREFTALVVDVPGSSIPKVYPVLERVFDETLTPLERFLSVDVYWKRKFVSKLAPEKDRAVLEEIAVAAYQAVGGNGYARLGARFITNI